MGRQEEGRAVGAGALVARVVGGLAVVDEAVEEGAGGEVVQGGGAGAVVEQELVAQQHQRLAEGAVHLRARVRGGTGRPSGCPRLRVRAMARPSTRDWNGGCGMCLRRTLVGLCLASSGKLLLLL